MPAGPRISAIASPSHSFVPPTRIVTGVADMNDNDLGRWLAEIRAGNAAHVKRRQRWLEQQATEEATFVGTLTDLAESGGDVIVETSAGRRHAGRIEAVGIDFVALVALGRWVFIPLAAAATVRRVLAGPQPPSGARVGALDLTLLEALADQLPERPRIVTWSGSGERITGLLAGVGHDVVTVRLDSDPPRAVHIAALSIAEITF